MEVKKANSRFSADCLHPSVTQNMILEAAKNAVKLNKTGKSSMPLKIEAPISIEVEFRSSDMADKVEIMPGIIRIDGRKIRFSCETMPDAYCEFRKIVNLAG